MNKNSIIRIIHINILIIITLIIFSITFHY